MPRQSLREGGIRGLLEIGKRTQARDVFSSVRTSGGIYRSVPVLSKSLGKIKTNVTVLKQSRFSWLLGGKKMSNEPQIWIRRDALCCFLAYSVCLEVSVIKVFFN